MGSLGTIIPESSFTSGINGFSNGIIKQSPSSDYDLDVGHHQTKIIGEALEITESTPKLFQPLTIRGNVFHNRVMVSPMCMYSCKKQDGVFTDFHLVHYGNFALRGTSLVMIEASAVEPRGRLSPEDAGIWSDEHSKALERIVRHAKASGAKIGIQLAHGGRKAGTYPPFHKHSGSTYPPSHKEGDQSVRKVLRRAVVPREEGGFGDEIVAPTATAWKDDEGYPVPNELSRDEIKEIAQKFVEAAKRSVEAGVDVIEIHAAHGYLIHSFLSGNTNKRTDEYGGSLQNRLRFLLEIIQGTREVIPETMPLFCRVSGTDYALGDMLTPDPQGWDIFQVIELCKQAVPLGLDVIDISSGGNLPNVYKGLAQDLSQLGFQLPLAEQVKLANIPGLTVAAVGCMHDPKTSETFLQEDKADLIFIGREFLRNPSWVYTAAEELGVEARWADQYSWMPAKK